MKRDGFFFFGFAFQITDAFVGIPCPGRETSQLPREPASVPAAALGPELGPDRPSLAGEQGMTAGKEGVKHIPAAAEVWETVNKHFVSSAPF